MLVEELYNRWIQIYPYMEDYLKLTSCGDIDVYVCKDTDDDYRYLLFSILNVTDVSGLSVVGVFFDKNYGPSLDDFKDAKSKYLKIHDLDAAWAFIEEIMPSIDSVINWYKKVVIDRNVAGVLSHLNFYQTHSGSSIWGFCIDDTHEYIFIRIYLPTARRLHFICKVTTGDTMEKIYKFMTFDELLTWLTSED